MMSSLNTLALSTDNLMNQEKYDLATSQSIGNMTSVAQGKKIDRQRNRGNMKINYKPMKIFQSRPNNI